MLDGYQYKKNALQARVGRPALDPFVAQKRKDKRGTADAAAGYCCSHGRLADPEAKRAKAAEEDGKTPEEVIAMRVSYVGTRVTLGADACAPDRRPRTAKCPIRNNWSASRPHWYDCPCHRPA